MCREYLDNWEGGRRWCNVELEFPWGKLLKRCYTCKTLVGATVALKALVLREPWLVTEGVAGAPAKEAWEMEEEKAVEGEEDDDDDADGWTKEERAEIRRKAVEAVARWGLMAAEQAAEKEAK